MDYSWDSILLITQLAWVFCVLDQHYFERECDNDAAP